MPTPMISTIRPPFPALRKSSEPIDRSETLVIGFRLNPDPERQAAMRQLIQDHAHLLPHNRPPFNESARRRVFGVAQKVLERVAAALKRLGFEIVEQDAADGEVFIRAPIPVIEKALGIEFYQVERDGQTYRTFDGPVRLPKFLRSRISDVSGLDSVPVITPRTHSRPATDQQKTVRQVAELYDFPLEQRGAGQTAVIIMLGGGYHQKDLDTYFQSLGIPKPRIEDDEIRGATNAPASSATLQALFKGQGFDVAPAPGHEETEDGSGDLVAATWTVEATTDIQILAALLPEARIVVIFAPNTQDDQAAAMQRALSDEFAQKYGRPSVISCSWGQYEYTMRNSSRDLMESHLQKAVALGVTVCNSSGDVGGGFVYYPASSPYVLSCGGTNILTVPDQDTGQPMQEEVWREQRLDRYYSATSGGLSSAFEAPSWQAEAVKPWGGGKRGIPDVAGHAGIATGYSLVIGGVQVGIGGTSAVAPLMAALVAQINGANAGLAKDYRVGWLTPHLYDEAFQSAFQPITEGSSGLYSPNGTWDPCTGLGRPIGSRLLELLRSRDAGSSGPDATGSSSGGGGETRPSGS